MLQPGKGCKAPTGPRVFNAPFPSDPAPPVTTPACGGTGALKTRGPVPIFYSSSASRARARSFSVSLFSWPQAARMSRPRGVRTGLA